MPLVKFKWTKEYEEKSCEDAPNYCREWIYWANFKSSSHIVGRVVRVGVTSKFRGYVYTQEGDKISNTTLKQPIRDKLSEAKQDVEAHFKRF